MSLHSALAECFDRMYSMNPIILNTSNSIVNTFIAELRDQKVQQDPIRFRMNLERLGWFIAYELSKSLEYENREIETSLGTAIESILSDDIVLGTVLRAGLPFHQGFLEVFDRAENAFVGAARVEVEGQAPDVSLGYMASPSLEAKVLVVVDPMIATGQSLVAAINSLIESSGQPKSIIICGAIGAQKGVEYVAAQLPNAQIYVGAVDEELNDSYYIVPGLGDAGDLAFGGKL